MLESTASKEMLKVIRRLLAAALLCAKENGPMIDVAVLGRVGIDLYPNQLRTPLREVRTYTRFVGGFAGNVATGLARLGLTPGIVSRVGPDPHGEFVRDFLSAEGVDVRFLAVDERLMTPPTFCEVWPPDHFPITFYRYPTAPDWQIAPEDFDGEEVAAAPFLLAFFLMMRQPPSRETTLAALAAHQGTTIFDLDWRPTLWEQAGEYGEQARIAVRSEEHTSELQSHVNLVCRLLLEK